MNYFMWCRSEGSGSVSATFHYGAGNEQNFMEENYAIHPGELIGEGYDPASGHKTIPLAVLMETQGTELCNK